MNANDFFCYASAGFVNISSLDIPWIITIIQEFPDYGLDACLSYIANREPIKPRRTDEFIIAIKKLQDLNPIVISDLDFVEEYDDKGPYRSIQI